MSIALVRKTYPFPTMKNPMRESYPGDGLYPGHIPRFLGQDREGQGAIAALKQQRHQRCLY
jgi:hypothetical protein